ncbi:ExeA family protein [Geoalkalibacter sp.]|uniref:ExeA family protein n=1 Tax=Geoalkalibacter sp. TaxID=3041440 RepID=UPI00272E1E96|nr:AAA family ATPase [Geoalkalibacter sp.]
MYLDYFGLQEAPFSIAPDPRYLFMSEHHREALAHLVYGIRSEGGFVLLTGEVGTGKTTVCRCLLEQLPDNCEVAFVLNPKVTSRELLATICDELGIAYPEGNQSVKVFVDRINAYLLANHAAGRRTVVIIDEAQNLGPAVLEQLRLLTNLETNREKLLQVILLGQPEFREMLARQELRQLSQRITARYHLTPLSFPDMQAYVRHRLQVAGLAPAACAKLFPQRVLRRLFRLSGGVPRLVNLLCDRALLGVFANEEHRVSLKILKQAAHEVFGPRLADGRSRPWLWGGAAAAACGLVLAGILWNFGGEPGAERVQASLPETARQKIAPPPEENVETAPAAPSAGLSWPAQVPRAQGERLAFEGLLARWDITELPAAESDLCRFVGELGLQCLRDRGTLRTLEVLDRPAVLSLFDEDNQPFFATLIGLEPGMATLLVGGEERRVARAEIEARWLGEYTLVWRVPPEYTGNLHPGARDPFVLWLAARLAGLEGREAEPRTSLDYDRALVQDVRRFQLSHGLQPDGIVGSKTLIRMGGALGGVEPRLSGAGS